MKNQLLYVRKKEKLDRKKMLENKKENVKSKKILKIAVTKNKEGTEVKN